MLWCITIQFFFWIYYRQSRQNLTNKIKHGLYQVEHVMFQKWLGMTYFIWLWIRLVGFLYCVMSRNYWLECKLIFKCLDFASYGWHLEDGMSHWPIALLPDFYKIYFQNKLNMIFQPPFASSPFSLWSCYILINILCSINHFCHCKSKSWTLAN